MKLYNVVLAIVVCFLSLQATGSTTRFVVPDLMDQNPIIVGAVEERLAVDQLINNQQSNNNIHLHRLQTLLSTTSAYQIRIELPPNDSYDSEDWEILYLSTQGYHSLPAIGLLILLGILTGLVYKLYERCESHSNEKQ